MTKIYGKLRGRLRELGLTQQDLARKLILSERGLANKMCGCQPWTQDEMYDAAAYLDWPEDQLHDLFPPRPRRITKTVRVKKQAVSRTQVQEG